MRNPKCEEHCVLAAIRLPCEEVGLDKLHRLVSVPCPRQRQHLRCRVEGGDGRSKASEVLGPHTGAARQFQYIARWAKRVDRREQRVQTDEVKTGVSTCIRIV